MVSWGHKKASNVASYGDTGRLPLVLTLMDQSLRYFKRVSITDKNTLVAKAYAEQKRLKLQWYQTWEALERATSTHAAKNREELPRRFQCSFQNDMFINEWANELRKQSKLRFYRKSKHDFGLERYIGETTYRARKHLFSIRSSAHDLNIERGRYSTKNKQPKTSDRACRFCCGGESQEAIRMFEELPFSLEPILETEEHALATCPAYHSQRMSLSDNLKSLLLLHEYKAITDSEHAEEFGVYLQKCYRIRNPRPSN